MITFRHRGNFKKTEKFLNGAKRLNLKKVMERYAIEGVRALASATPVDSGLTADSWGYKIEISKGSSSIYWTNSNSNKGTQIAVILQYGHGTGTGGYVQGRDYINPAIRPIFDKLAESAWLEVTKL